MLPTFLTILSLLALDAVANSVLKLGSREEAWTRQWLAPRDAPIMLHMALRQYDGGREIERRLMEVSDPDSPLYRHFLPAGEITYLSPPAQGSVHAVESWLKGHSLLGNTSLYGGIMEISTSVRRAEKLLNTTYFTFSDGTQDIIRTERYYLPETVARHIDFVTPTTSFPRASRQSTDSDLVQQTSKTIAPAESLDTHPDCPGPRLTPGEIRQAYEVDYNATPGQTSFAVYAVDPVVFDDADLQTYLKLTNPPAAQKSPSYQIVRSATTKGSVLSERYIPNFEAAGDVQTTLGLAWPAQGIYFEDGGMTELVTQSTHDHLFHFLHQMIVNKTVPSVVTFSGGYSEDFVDATYARRLCNMMGQIGSRGVTLVFSSGDNGPSGNHPQARFNTRFSSIFPASCPFVTAVGGTTTPAHEVAATKSTLESTRSQWTSGGGFSNLFAAPDYQISAVRNYVDTHVPDSYYDIPGFSENGRGIPDVSALSACLLIIVDGVETPFSGTSASAPVWAGIVTLLNDYEASRGRPHLGFINPWLYKLTSGLKDIEGGGNNAGFCKSLTGLPIRCPQVLGYNTTKGWDAVTGLGSPIFSRLTQALDAHPPPS